jgi:ElaB/YqjD/DUF883 family membrane-anchored ribosome-binding protein
MMTSPDLNNTGNTGYDPAIASTGGEGLGSTQESGNRTDDVSFARNMGVDQTSDKMDKVKDVAQRGVAGAQDAMSQLQAKASELTASLIDKVNVDELTQKLEMQVREHPARTLMMAAGAGFLLGRAAKK